MSNKPLIIQAQIIVDRFLQHEKSYDFDLNIYECMTLIVLARFSRNRNECFPPIPKIAKNGRMSRDSVFRALNSLESKNLVIRSTELGKVNHYKLNLEILTTPPVANSDGLSIATSSCQLLHQSLIATTPVAVSDTKDNINNNKNNNYMSTSSPEGLKPSLESPKDLRNAEYKKQAIEILAFLNQKAGRAYRPTKTNLDFIIARLKSGATVMQCRQVIVKKTREWKPDAKMSQYLRPATLFNATKFEQYLGELVIVEEKNENHELP
jgi:uncharacterized phage protein (TIGR02220 family)